MNHRSLLAAAALGMGLLASPTAATATTFAQSTEAERVARADLAVRGTVVEMWAEQDSSGRVITRVMIEPEAVLKGQAPDGAVLVTQAGGEVAGLRTLVAGVARFNVGEQVVVLLEYKERFDNYVLINMVQGKYTIRMDPHTHREVVQQTVVPDYLEYDHRFLPFAAAEDKVFLDDLVTLIQTTPSVGISEVPR
jgi:hypothetical protein